MNRVLPAATADYEEQAAVNLELTEAMTRPLGGAAALASVGSDDLLAVAEFVDATGGGCGDGLPGSGTGGVGNAAAAREEGEEGSRDEEGDLAQ